MKLLKHIKKITAVALGSFMLGSTLVGASAMPDLNEYPSQFIKDGKFSGLMIVGSAASTSDVLGIVDIATGLQYDSKIDKIISPANNVLDYDLTGDVYKISTTSDMLNLNEALGKVKSTITKENIGILESSRIRTQRGSTDMDQYLKFSSDQSGLRPVYDKNRTSEVADFLKADNNAYIFTYEVQFPEGLKSSSYKSISDNEKITTGTGTLNDINNEDLYLLGQPFNIGMSSITKDGQIKLQLMAGQHGDTMGEYETKIYELGNKTYKVYVPIVGNTGDNSNLKVRFTINDETTKALQEGDTETLRDGTIIGVTSIMSNEGTELKGTDTVSFYIGANKIELMDPNYADNSASGSIVKVGETIINAATIEIDAVWSGDEVTFNSLKYSLKADSKYNGDLFISKNESLRTMLEQPDAMLSNNWDLRYLGLSANAQTSDILITPSSDDSYYFVFTNQEGITYNFPFVDTSNDRGRGFKFGTEREKLVFIEPSACSNYSDAPIELDDYFIVSKRADQDKAFTHVLTFDRVQITNGIVSVSDISSGGNKDISYDKALLTNSTCVPAKNDLIIGGESYKVNVCADNPLIDTQYRLCVDLNGDGSVSGGDGTTITASGGAVISFSNPWTFNYDNPAPTGYEINRDGTINNATKIDIAFTVLGKYTDSNVDETFSFNIIDASSGTKRQVDTYYNINDAIGLKKENEKDSDYKSGSTTYGVHVKEYDPSGSSDAGSLIIEFPSQQSEAKVYVIGSGTTNTQATLGSGDTIVPEYSRISVGAAILDTELRDLDDANLIVVGGPCANNVAATLMDLPPTMPGCYEQFPVKEGEGIIKMVENGDKVAMIVAGYSASDTRNAAKVIANYRLANYGLNKLKLQGPVVYVRGSEIMPPPAPAVAETLLNDTNTTIP